MEKTANIILIALFIMLAACICLPIVFVSGTVSKICIIIGLVALIFMSGFVNYLTWESNKPKENDRKDN